MFRGISKFVFESRQAKKKGSQKKERSRIAKCENGVPTSYGNIHPFTPSSNHLPFFQFSRCINIVQIHSLARSHSLFQPVIGHQIVYQVSLVIVTKLCHRYFRCIRLSQHACLRSIRVNASSNNRFSQRSSFFIHVKSV